MSLLLKKVLEKGEWEVPRELEKKEIGLRESLFLAASEGMGKVKGKLRRPA